MLKNRSIKGAATSIDYYYTRDGDKRRQEYNELVVLTVS